MLSLRSISSGSRHNGSGVRSASGSDNSIDLKIACQLGVGWASSLSCFTKRAKFYGDNYGFTGDGAGSMRGPAD